jgi:hypothetical protein
MSERDAVLFANEAFYRAFADRDLREMDKVWAQRLDVACLHPGWHPLIGRAAVMESWAAILGNAQQPAIRVRDPKVQLHGDVAVVVCFEEIEGNFLVASNVFARDGSVWKLVLHQAGATAGRPAPDEELPDKPKRMN